MLVGVPAVSRNAAARPLAPPAGAPAGTAERTLTAEPLAPPPRFWTCALLLAAVAVLWVATRPYAGIVHDGRLYTLQALASADPARFAEDLFLRFGSQDSFTLFSRFYEPVLRWAGISGGAMIATLLGQAIWLGGAYALAGALLRDSVRALVAVAGLVALPGTYGADLNFSYGEPFLSPRLFAEALTMLALGFAVRGRAVLAGTVLAVAALLHPIMAAPGAAVFLLLNAFRDRRWWPVPICGVAVALGAAAAGVEPFARLGVRFDDAWFETVRRRGPDVFMAGWSLIDYCVLASQAALAVLALSVPTPRVRPLVGAVLLVAVGGIALTALGADLARNQFIANVQPWRATWLLCAIAHLLAPSVLAEFAGGVGAARPFTRGLVFGGTGLLFLALLTPGAFLWSSALLAGAALLVRRPLDAEPPGPVLRVLAVGGAAVIAASVAHLAFASKADLDVWPEEYWARLWGFGLGVSALWLAAAAALRAAPSTGRGAPDPVATAVAACLVFCAALGWDQRTAWTKFVESPGPLPSDLAGFVADDATVYWDAGVELLWLRLRKASYHSCMQGAGVLFFRGTAAAYQHRAESFPFETARTDRCWKGGAGPGETPTPTPEGLRRACAREPELDVLVLPHAVEGLPRREWRPPVMQRYPLLNDGKLQVRDFDRFYAYACEELR